MDMLYYVYAIAVADHALPQQATTQQPRIQTGAGSLRRLLGREISPDILARVEQVNAFQAPPCERRAADGIRR